jgi:uncharacterized protein (TIGR02646 family)
MIQVKRSAAPLALADRRLVGIQAEAEKFFAEDTRSARQRPFGFGWAPPHIQDEVLEALARAWSDRCAFCGSPAGRELLIHRFRPPQDAVAEDGGTSRRHYWWLAYDWDNLYPACARCQEAQGAKFPTDRTRVRAGVVERLNEREAPLLLDPCDDDPEAVLIYVGDGVVVAEDRRALATIETFDLNRPELVEERCEAVGSVKAQLGHAGERLRNEEVDGLVADIFDLFDRKAPFAAVRRQFANQWVQFRHRKVNRALGLATRGEEDVASLAAGLPRITTRIREEALLHYRYDESVSVSVPSGTPAPEKRAQAPRKKVRKDIPKLRPVEVHRLEITNFRGIEHLELNLSLGPPEGSWTMLLGENGAGKTSILQALALALCDPDTIQSLQLNPRRILRQGSKEGVVRVQLARGERELRFGRGIEGFELAGSPIFGILLAGYGPTRLPPDGPIERRAPQQIANLFDPRAPLVDPAECLATLESDEFDAVARALRSLLELPEDDEITRRRGLEIVRGGHRFGLDQLSDGYRSMALFSLDLIQLLLLRWGSVAAAEGIVLVDEIGAHLHPRWQMRITGLLRETFPRMQFVATTHEPLCLRGLHDGEVVVLRQQKERVYALHGELPSVEGLAVDQLLTSEHFGLSSTLDPEIQADFERYYELLAKRRRSAADEQELDHLTVRLDRLQLLGTTRRERLALEGVDRFLADETEVGSDHEFTELKESTLEAVREIWEEGVGR